MTPEEIAALRRMATTGGLVSLTGKELSALLLERDHYAAEAKALREAAGALIDGLTKHLDGADVGACEDWVNPDVRCGGIATRRLSPPTGEIYKCFCDACAEERVADGWTDGGEFPFAGPLITLRALLSVRALLGRTP